MADYFIDGTQVAIADPGVTTLSVERGGGRIKVFEINSGFILASPADQLLEIALRRFATADGTGTAARVPNPLDLADAACQATGFEDHTIEPTTFVTNTEGWKIAQHMRATYRWVAAPGKDIVVPDTTANGVALVAFGPGAPVHTGSLYFSE